MYQKEQIKDENETKYEHYTNQDLSSSHMVNIVNNQSVRQFTSTPLLDNDVRVSYNLVDPVVSQLQHDVIQMCGGKGKKGKRDQPGITPENDFIKRICKIDKFTVFKDEETKKKDFLVVRQDQPEKQLGKYAKLQIVKPPVVNFQIIGVETEGILLGEALKAIAHLHRIIYNQYLLSSLPASKKTVLVRYYVKIIDEAQAREYLYMQEIAYSSGAAGYVLEEFNGGNLTRVGGSADREPLTVIKERKGITGMGGGKEYQSRHKHTHADSWIELLKNGKGGGDNGSKLTAENARFQLLMDDEGTSDYTWYMLSKDREIFFVNALELTANFGHVMDSQRGVEESKRTLPIFNREIVDTIKAGKWEGFSESIDIQKIINDKLTHEMLKKPFSQLIEAAKGADSKKLLQLGHASMVYIIHRKKLLEQCGTISEEYMNRQTMDILPELMKSFNERTIVCREMDKEKFINIYFMNAALDWLCNRVKNCNRLIFASDFDFSIF